MKKQSILFVCVHNSARSQMGQAFANHEHADVFEASSAGLEAGSLNPIAVTAMAELDIDISDAPTTGVDALIDTGKRFDIVVTVCKGSEGECPMFPGQSRRLAWPFDDPSSMPGTPEEKLAGARIVRDQIRQAVSELADDLRAATKQ